jgi:uracil-DNA glycosylase family 4
MQLIRPKVVITLGKDVANFLLNNEEKMGNMRGHVYDYMGAKLISTYHPSYLARGGGINHRHFGKVVNDFSKAKEFI